MDNRGQGSGGGPQGLAQSGVPGSHGNGRPNMPPVPAWGAAPDKSRRMAIYGVITGVAIVLAALFGLNALGVLQFRGMNAASGMLQATGEKPGELLKAQGEKPGALLEAQGAKPGPTLSSQSPPPENIQMPEDVRDWLEHLRRTEEKRMSVANAQVAQAMVLMSELQGAGASMEQLQGLLDEGSEGTGTKTKTPADTASTKTQAMRREWVDLTAFFNSKKPPAECIAIRDNYDEALRETGGMMNDLIGIISNVGDDPSGAIAKLQAMKGKSTALIDKPAIAADDGVAAVCRKYQTRKWFDVKGDVGGGLMKIGM